MPRSLVVVLALATTLLAAPAAGAATLATSTRCYQELQDVIITGTGYAPMGKVAISRDGEPFGTADADAAGAFTVKFPASELPRGDRESVSTLTAIDGALNTASTRYRTTRIFADFAPSEGDPRTLKVRFEVNGFGLLRRNASVYLHYVNPNGKSVRTVRLGTARGTCGKVTRTRLRHLFPFPEPQRGRWVLQFDTNSRYTRATSRSPYIWVRKPVLIFRA